MKRNYNIIHALALTAVMVLCFSCKKDETTATKNYLDGSLKVEDVDFYQPTEAVVKFKVSGISHPKGNKMLLSYKLNEKTDTIKDREYTADKAFEFEVKMPSDPGDYSMTISILPEDKSDYYSASSNATLHVIHQQKSYTGYEVPSQHKFTDPRDGKTYPYVKVGETEWMCTNMAYAGKDEELGIPFHSSVMDIPWGRIYNWEDACKACPEGWQLPSDADFVALAGHFNPEASYSVGQQCKGVSGSFIMKGQFNGADLWPYNPDIKIPAEPLFCALPAGWVNIPVDSDYKYHSFMEVAAFWTSDRSGYENQAIYRHINLDSNVLMIGSGDADTMGMSVRCIKK